jgi:myo-inositol-1(or 4)-monophosphatase
MPDENLNRYLDTCIQAARDGGESLVRWAGRVDSRVKGAGNDLVTQADLASQAAVRDVILAAFPDHAVLGEEEQLGHDPAESAEYRWIVDPLDGTTNYVHGLPFYCVSIALEHRGELLVGAVFDPNRDECYTAAAGGGAWCNGRPIAVSRTQRLADALTVAGFPYELRADSPDMELFVDLAPRCRSVRRTGSSALNLCYLAAGRFDLFGCYSTKPWDVAAGVLIAAEAGGVVTGPTGGAFRPSDGRFLAAATPALHRQLLDRAMQVAGQPGLA